MTVRNVNKVLFPLQSVGSIASIEERALVNNVHLLYCKELLLMLVHSLFKNGRPLNFGLKKQISFKLCHDIKLSPKFTFCIHRSVFCFGIKIILLEAHFGGLITRKLEIIAEMFISQYFLLEINSEISRYHFYHETLISLSSSTCYLLEISDNFAIAVECGIIVIQASFAATSFPPQLGRCLVRLSGCAWHTGREITTCAAQQNPMQLNEENRGPQRI